MNRDEASLPCVEDIKLQAIKAKRVLVSQIEFGISPKLLIAQVLLESHYSTKQRIRNNNIPVDRLEFRLARLNPYESSLYIHETRKVMRRREYRVFLLHRRNP